MFKNELIEFNRLVSYVTNNKDLVQASGGNISLKLNSKIMRIKASGEQIKDITNNKGFIDVDYIKINKFMNSKKNNIKIDESNFFINKNNKERMSIEVYFHSVLGKVVLHTHPIQLNSVLVADNAKLILQELTNSKNFIPYIKPGILLGRKVEKLINEYKEKNDQSCIVFYLQNHGVIISGDNVDVVIKESDRLQKIFIKFLNTKKKLFSFKDIQNKLNIKDQFFVSENKFVNKIITKKPYLINYLATNPDTVIFCGPKPFYVNSNQINNDLDYYFQKFKIYPKIFIINFKLYYFAKSQKQAYLMEEVFLSHLFIITNCPANIKFLSHEEIYDLVQRDDEKYRLDLIK